MESADQHLQVERLEGKNWLFLLLAIIVIALEMLHTASDLFNQPSDDMRDDLGYERVDVAFRNVITHFGWLLLILLHSMDCFSLRLRITLSHHIELNSFLETDYAIFDLTCTNNAVEDIDSKRYMFISFTLFLVDDLKKMRKARWFSEVKLEEGKEISQYDIFFRVVKHVPFYSCLVVDSHVILGQLFET